MSNVNNWNNFMKLLEPISKPENSQELTHVQTEMISYLPPYSKDYFLENDISVRNIKNYNNLMAVTSEFLCVMDEATKIKITSLRYLNLFQVIELHKESVFDLVAFDQEKTGQINDKKLNLFGTSDFSGKIVVFNVNQEDFEKIQIQIIMTFQTKENTFWNLRFKSKFQLLAFSKKEISVFRLSEQNYDKNEQNQFNENSQISDFIIQPTKYLTKILEKNIIEAQFSHKNDLIYLAAEDNSLTLFNVELLDKVREFYPYGNDGGLIQILAYRNIFKKPEKNLEVPDDFTLKDFFLTVNDKYEIRVWDLSEWDNEKNSYFCIEELKIDVEEGGWDKRISWGFDYTSNFLFLISKESNENILHIYHVNSLFYENNEKLVANKKKTKFFNYCKEYKLQERPIVQFSFINIKNDELGIYFNTDEKTSFVANAINENENMNKSHSNLNFCDSKTNFALFCLFDSCFNVSIVSSENAYPIYLVEDLDKIEKENTETEPTASTTKVVGNYPPDMPEFILALAQKPNENEATILEEKKEERSRAESLQTQTKTHEQKSPLPPQRSSFSENPQTNKADNKNSSSPENHEKTNNIISSQHSVKIPNNQILEKGNNNAHISYQSNEKNNSSLINSTSNNNLINSKKKKNPKKRKQPEIEYVPNPDFIKTEILQKITVDKEYTADSNRMIEEAKVDTVPTKEDKTEKRKIEASNDQSSQNSNLETLLSTRFQQLEDRLFQKLLSHLPPPSSLPPPPPPPPPPANPPPELDLTKLFADQFEKVVTPCFEKYLIKMFEQVHQTFEKGQRFFVERLALEQTKSQHIKDSLTEVVKMFTQISAAISENFHSSQTSAEKIELLLSEKQAQISKLVATLSELIKKEEELSSKTSQLYASFQESFHKFKSIPETPSLEDPQTLLIKQQQENEKARYEYLSKLYSYLAQSHSHSLGSLGPPPPPPPPPPLNPPSPPPVIGANLNNQIGNPAQSGYPPFFGYPGQWGWGDKKFSFGMQGMPGMSGMPGMPGMPGMQGMPGMTGMTGMSGMQGMPGMQGFKDGK